MSYEISYVTEKTWLMVAELWFNQDYSPLEIAREMDLTIAEASAMTDLLSKIKNVATQGIIDKIKEVLDR